MFKACVCEITICKLWSSRCISERSMLFMSSKLTPHNSDQYQFECGYSSIILLDNIINVEIIL